MFSRKKMIDEPKACQTTARSASYIKPSVEPKASTSIKESLVNKYTNFTYSFTGGMQKFKSVFVSESSMQYPGYTYILGKRFSSRAEALQYFHTLIWFSYRKIPGITKDINSDTSWGCLIRVGQMALAAALKKHLIIKTKYSEKTINSNIIPAFLDHEDRSCKYSLTKIVEEAKVHFKINYGQWFTVSQICSVLDTLHRRNPMRGTEDLKTTFYAFSQIFIEDVVKLMGRKPCTCSKRRVACPNCNKIKQREQTKDLQTFLGEPDYSKSLAFFKNHKQDANCYKSQFISEKMKPEQQNHVLVFVTCQLCFNSKVPDSKFKQLKEILALDCSLGIIGGIPRKGLYFVGYDANDNKLIYLDPHYVQEEVKLYNLLEMMDTFFYKDFRKCDRQEMDPSVALVFYFEDLKALQKLYEKIEEIKEKYTDYILSIEWQNQFPEGEMQQIQFQDLDCDEDLGGECDNSFIYDD